MDKTPNSIRLGKSGLELTELGKIATLMGISSQGAQKLCEVLRVPIIYIGKGAYINTRALEQVLYYLTIPGGAGFATPSSRKRERLSESTKTIPIKLSDEDLAKVNDIRTTARMMLDMGKNPSRISGLIKKLGEASDEPDSSSREPDGQSSNSLRQGTGNSPDQSSQTEGVGR